MSPAWQKDIWNLLFLVFQLEQFDAQVMSQKAWCECPRYRYLFID